MRKDIKTFLEQNNFVYENRECVEYAQGINTPYGDWTTAYHGLFYKQFKYFQVMLFVAPHFDRRFPPHKNMVLFSVII